jgi:hypothetical protein
MKLTRCATLVVTAVGFAALGGCGLLSESHPTTESRYMTPTEQAYWNDRQTRIDKSEYWSSEVRRQSAARMSRYMGN